MSLHRTDPFQKIFFQSHISDNEKSQRNALVNVEASIKICPLKKVFEQKKVSAV